MVALAKIDKILKGCLLFEVVGTVIVMILTAALVAWFNDQEGWSGPPGKLSWNLAVAVITLVFFISMRLTKSYKSAWWEKIVSPKYSWPRVLIHGIFFVFWLIAAGTSFYTCSDLCGPVSGSYDIWWSSGKVCSCNQYVLEKRITFPKSGARKSHGGHDTNLYEAMQAFDFLLMFCFLATTGLIFYRWHLDNREPADRQEMQEQGTAGPPPVLPEEVHGEPEHQTEQPKHESFYQGT